MRRDNRHGPNDWEDPEDWEDIRPDEKKIEVDPIKEWARELKTDPVKQRQMDSLWNQHQEEPSPEPDAEELEEVEKLEHDGLLERLDRELTRELIKIRLYRKDENS